MRKPSIVYLTCNDQPSGVYFSQVSDVCRFYEEELGIKARLVALVSIRSYFSSRRAIKQSWKRSWVLPMAPGIRRWKWNLPVLMLIAIFMKNRTWIGRNPHACSLALSLRRMKLALKVCFDGRGAIHAEWTEYQMTKDAALLEELKQLEKNCVASADCRLAVSDALVKYWKEEFNAGQNNTFVIPCTLSKAAEKEKIPDTNSLIILRKLLGYETADVVIVYSGSSAGWQSGKLMEQFFRKLLQAKPTVKVLWLAPPTNESKKLEAEFPGRVRCTWVKPSEVTSLLMACDYGLLIREPGVTNKVSSPTKFAEYLSAGLKVLISPGIGDFSAFTEKHHCGIVMAEQSPELSPVSYDEKRWMNEIALQYFIKPAFTQQYQSIAGE